MNRPAGKFYQEMGYEYKQFYRRNLPNRHSPGSTLFVTIRLAGSIPKSVLSQWKAEEVWLDYEFQRIEKEISLTKSEQAESQKERLVEFHRKWFRKFEDVLHEAAVGPIWLKDDRIAKIVAEALHHRDGKVYRLDAYCVMPNHVHVVFMPLLNEMSLTEVDRSPVRFESKEPPLDVIMHSLKSYTAQEANKVLKRRGSFWETESYDREIRDDAEYHRTVKYVLNNPVKAGLVRDWSDWRWNWKKK